MPFQALDVSGDRYGRLTAIKRVANRGRATFWLFRCDCGSLTEASLGAVRSGDIRSCGCLNIERIRDRSSRHGMYRTPTYIVWRGMLSRCDNPNYKKFAAYGGRGIKVCERWRKFENFLADMGVRPHGLTLDRIDNDGHYEPGNCRWATMTQQRANQRNQVLYQYNGEHLLLAEIARRSGVSYENLRYRVIRRGQPVESAIALAKAGKWRRME